MKDANSLISGVARNLQDDLLILHNIGVPGKYPSSPSFIEVSWNLPPPGWLKVNIDGSSKGAPGVFGCGGIFKNCRGFVKGCFAIHLGICFAFEAEIMGFIIAIEIAHKFNWLNLWVDTDSTFVSWLFQSNASHIPWKLRNRWNRANRWAKLLNVRISHIYREGNCVVDRLASLATTPSTFLWQFSTPENIQRLIYRDMIPLPFYRFRNL